MTRKKRTPEEIERRAKIRVLLRVMGTVKSNAQICLQSLGK